MVRFITNMLLVAECDLSINMGSAYFDRSLPLTLTLFLVHSFPTILFDCVFGRYTFLLLYVVAFSTFVSCPFILFFNVSLLVTALENYTVCTVYWLIFFTNSVFLHY